MAAVEELVHRPGFVPVLVLQGLLFLVEQLIEALLHGVHRVVHVVLGEQIAGLLGELPHELLHSHHAKVLPRHVEPVLAHVLKGLAGVHAVHHVLGQGVERRVRIQGELLLGPVPATVAKDLHVPP